MLVTLRVAIGWHFLYEGVIKVIQPDWSSAAYLAESRWIFSGLFHWISATPSVLKVVDMVNVFGLIVIGLALMLGCFSRIAGVAGMLLLAMYYVANPPFLPAIGTISEGTYLFIDKNFVEFMALGVLVMFPTSHLVGLERLLQLFRSPKAPEEQSEEVKPAVPSKVFPEMGISMRRRELMKSLATVPFVGGFAFAAVKKYEWDSFEEKHLAAAADDVDSVSGATVRSFRFTSIKELKGQIPKSQIGDLKLSRVILGGNLIGGWAHSRDLIYVSKLIKSYHTDERVFQTLRLAEECGINTILTNPVLCRVINKYWNKADGKIQFISDCALGGDVIKGIQVSIDGGAHSCYIQGGISDSLVKNGKVEEIGKALDFIRQNGLQAGIGAHALATVQECVRIGLKPDYWVKTLHHCDYWSASPAEEHDNIWCTNPEDTVAYMRDLEEPWIAFKILAAGAIHPNEGFKYAFQNGADFICVGMYDFQVVEDANIALDVLASDFSDRERPWRA